MTARDEVLARIRSAIGSGTQATGDIPRAYRMTTQDGLDAFLERLAHYDARAIQTDAADLDATVRTTLEDRGAPARPPPSTSRWSASRACTARGRST